MQKLRYGLVVLSMLLWSVTFAEARVSIGIGFPNVSIGINLPFFPDLTPVPGYPVYYAPQVDANYFFYDGMYWVYQDDNWYASSWYNGPWGFVEPEAVPLYVLRIPVRYYRQPPVYFRSWQSNAPPRWGQHWGPEWEQRRRGWDRWNRSAVPSRAPRPAYQRNYTGDRYPRVEQQHDLRNRSYGYQPRDRAVRRHFNQPLEQRAPAINQRKRPDDSRMISPPQEHHRSPQQQPIAPEQRSHPERQAPPPQRGPTTQPKSPQPGAVQREQQAPRVHGQEQQKRERGESPDRGQGHNRDEDRGQGQDRGQGHNRDEDRGRGR